MKFKIKEENFDLYEYKNFRVKNLNEDILEC